MSHIIGIDPGITGAIVVIDKATGKLMHTYDMPVMPWGADGKKRVPDYLGISAVLGQYPLDSMLYIERVNAMPRAGGNSMGATSAFNFGMGFGMLLGATLRPLAEINLVMPTVWKRHHNLLKTKKDDARILAIQMYPEAPLARKKDSGRADALLIAKYGFDKINGE